MLIGVGVWGACRSAADRCQSVGIHVVRRAVAASMRLSLRTLERVCELLSRPARLVIGEPEGLKYISPGQRPG